MQLNNIKQFQTKKTFSDDDLLKKLYASEVGSLIDLFYHIYILCLFKSLFVALISILFNFLCRSNNTVKIKHGTHAYKIILCAYKWKAVLIL